MSATRTRTGRAAGSRPTRKASLAALLLAGLLVLTGCGGIHYGQAANVAGYRITNSTVESLADNYCKAYARQLEGQGQSFPMGLIQTFAVQALVMKSIADQLADTYGVTAGKTYADKAATLRAGAEAFPKDQADAVVALESVQDYVAGVAENVGRELLVRDGISNPEYADAVARGMAEFDNFITSNKIDIDPRYGLTMLDGQPQQADTSVSYAVSPLATAGQNGAEDPEYAAGLPDAQRCG